MFIQPPMRSPIAITAIDRTLHRNKPYVAQLQAASQIHRFSFRDFSINRTIGLRASLDVPGRVGATKLYHKNNTEDNCRRTYIALQGLSLGDNAFDDRVGKEDRPSGYRKKSWTSKMLCASASTSKKKQIPVIRMLGRS